jgi:large subunit ribosomal protein L29
MEINKIRGLSDEELKSQELVAAEQLFRLRFSAKLGQNDGAKKLRSLKLDVARFKTIARERQLGIQNEAKPVREKAAKPAKEAKVKEVKAEAEAAPKKHSVKKAPANKAVSKPVIKKAAKTKKGSN